MQHSLGFACKESYFLPSIVDSNYSLSIAASNYSKFLSFPLRHIRKAC